MPGRDTERVHIPDGLIDAPVAAGAAVLAAGAVAVSIRGARAQLDDRTAPLAGLTAVFIFAAQMMNFPVGAGTSGHLIGAALAAVLVGPYTAVLVLTVVLTVQALVFADGGLTALGLNVLNMGVIAVLVAWAVFRGVTALLPHSRTAVVAGAAVAAWASVVAASLGFVAEYALGGTAPFSVTAVLAAMGGVHALIGIGEAIITALVVSAVLAVRPDLVFGARGLLPETELEVRSVTPARPVSTTSPGAR